MKIIEHGGGNIAVLGGGDAVIHTAQNALDIMATARYDGCGKMIIAKENICEEFFNLSSRLAGEILQKYTNYHFAVAIVGDFSGYASKSLRDFIYESNNGKQIFFVPDEKSALEKLGSI